MCFARKFNATSLKSAISDHCTLSAQTSLGRTRKLLRPQAFMHGINPAFIATLGVRSDSLVPGGTQHEAATILPSEVSLSGASGSTTTVTRPSKSSVDLTTSLKNMRLFSHGCVSTSSFNAWNDKVNEFDLSYVLAV